MPRIRGFSARMGSKSSNLHHILRCRLGFNGALCFANTHNLDHQTLMLVQFKVANFRSFAQEQILSLVASQDTSHPGNLIKSERYSLLKAVAIYGANASGKSNLIRAIQVMDQFVGTSATRMNLGDRIPGIVPFRLDEKLAKEPSSFEVTVLLNDKEYRYGFSATEALVHSEWMYVRSSKGGKRSQPLLRSVDAENDKPTWTLRGELKEQAKTIPEKTRENGLFLSRAAEMNVPFVKDLFLWFRNSLWYLDLAMPTVGLLQQTARGIHESADFRHRIERLLCDADLAIEGMTSRHEALHVPEDAPPEIRKVLSRVRRLVREISESEDFDFDKGRVYTVQTQHRSRTGDIVEFSLERDESNGTQRFFALIGPILNAIEAGSVFVVDELECSMHPLLARKLIELFQDPQTNRNGGQLIFATHDSTLMTPQLFRRDQLWFTEKNPDAATELFSLHDFREAPRPRKEEAFEKNYLSGRYGGVPTFGPGFEDLDLNVKEAQ